MSFIFQLREYPCNITLDIYTCIFSFTRHSTDIFRTKNYIPRIFLERECISAGKCHISKISNSVRINDNFLAKALKLSILPTSLDILDIRQHYVCILYVP